MRIHESVECSKSEIDLFSVPPTQTSIQEGFYDDIPADNSFNSSATIRIGVSGDSTHYLNLSEFEIIIQGYICKIGDEGVADTKKISVVNNLLGSLFKQAEISFNNKTVENTNDLYPYRDYITKTLGLSAQQKKSQLAGSLYYKDDPEKFNTCLIGANELKNSGFISRRTAILGKKIIELQGKLSCDVFNINHLLVPSVNVEVKLTKNDPKFYMLGDDAQGFYFNYTSVFLRIKRHIISPSVMEAHALLAETTSYKYPLRRIVAKHTVTPYGAVKFSLTGICKGIMPRRVIVGFVKNSAYDGEIKENPFEFQNILLKNISLKINSKSLPHSDGYSLDYAKGVILNGYRSLSKLFPDLDVTLDEYKNGYSLYSFDLNPDNGSCSHYSLLKDGQLDMDVSIERPLDSAYTVIFLCEFDNVIEIDRNRQINFDYIA